MKMPIKKNLWLLAALTAVFNLGFAQGPKPNIKKRPNILIILADDMGYSDLGCFGSEINTPNIDRLASEGIRFTQFYNRARCCPTRVSLLTGLYPHNAGLGDMTYMGDWGPAGYKNEINSNCVTIAEVLRNNGYSTLMSGKWHIGETAENWPRQRGFEEFFGLVQGGSNYFRIRPYGMLARNEQLYKTVSSSFYLTDAIGDSAVNMLKVQRKTSPEKPFFMYYAFTAPHWPLHAKPEDIKRYAGKYDLGWDKLRESRLKKMKSLGIVSDQITLSQRERDISAMGIGRNGKLEWENLSDSLKKDMSLRMAIYAAQIDNLDQNVGKVVDYLKHSGDLDNTIIIFMSDNGASAEGGLTGLNNSALVSGYKNNNDPGLKGEAGSADSFKSYGSGWANVSNTPFRFFKLYTHEGGIRAPFIVRWPGQINYKPGTVLPAVGDVIDIMPTILDIAKAEYPETSRGEHIRKLDGQSLLPILKGSKGIPERNLYWVHEGNGAMRSGHWKLVAERGDKWELYNLEIDPTEMNDLSSKYPDRVKQMSHAFYQWCSDNNVKDEFTDETLNRLMKRGDEYRQKLKALKEEYH